MNTHELIKSILRSAGTNQLNLQCEKTLEILTNKIEKIVNINKMKPTDYPTIRSDRYH